MIKVNFLTSEYKAKLFFQKFARLSVLLIILYVVITLGANTVINMVIDKKETNKAQIIAEIKDVKQKTNDKKIETSNIEDLSNKIQILEDIRNQRNYGFSEVLFQLQESVPEKVWLKSLVYSGNELIIKGIASEDRKSKLTAEKNLYRFETNLNNQERYINVSPQYSKASEIRGSKVQEFEYIITLTGIGNMTQ